MAPVPFRGSRQSWAHLPEVSHTYEPRSALVAGLEGSAHGPPAVHDLGLDAQQRAVKGRSLHTSFFLGKKRKPSRGAIKELLNGEVSGQALQEQAAAVSPLRLAPMALSGLPAPHPWLPVQTGRTHHNQGSLGPCCSSPACTWAVEKHLHFRLPQPGRKVVFIPISWTGKQAHWPRGGRGLSWALFASKGRQAMALPGPSQGTGGRARPMPRQLQSSLRRKVSVWVSCRFLTRKAVIVSNNQTARDTVIMSSRGDQTENEVCTCSARCKSRHQR